MLGERERELYARQILLPEIGMAGQRSLCRSAAALAPHADADAAAWTRAYLERAGLRITGPGAGDATVTVTVASPEQVDALAWDPALRPAAAALAGSLAAVEAIKQVLNVGAPGDFPADVPALSGPGGPPASDDDSQARPADDGPGHEKDKR